MDSWVDFPHVYGWLVQLTSIPFPDSLVPFLVSRDLVSLHLDTISTIGYISPEAMVAGLAMMTRHESLHMHFPHWDSLEHRARNTDPPIRVLLPALNELSLVCWLECIVDFMDHCDAPRQFRHFWTYAIFFKFGFP